MPLFGHEAERMPLFGHASSQFYDTIEAERMPLFGHASSHSFLIRQTANRVMPTV